MKTLTDAELAFWYAKLKGSHLAEANFVDPKNTGQCRAWWRHHDALAGLADALGASPTVQPDAGVPKPPKPQ